MRNILVSPFNNMFMTETVEMYSIDECLSNPDNLYVFGENEMQKNTKVMGGGQAIIRACPNSFGFCTLTGIGKYWSDDDFKTNTMRIEMDISELHTKAKKYNKIIFPKYGLGTGRAYMIQKCPRTFLYLCNRLLEEFNFNNIEHLQVPKF
jgi:hypothetical protein